MKPYVWAEANDYYAVSCTGDGGGSGSSSAGRMTSGSRSTEQKGCARKNASADARDSTPHTGQTSRIGVGAGVGKVTTIHLVYNWLARLGIREMEQS